MPLRIDILKYQGQPTGVESPIVINQEGATIGRSIHNSIVLREETVSRRHAQISFQNGRYYLTDQSSNGTLIYNRDLTIEGETVELLDGDILRIGNHELRVSMVVAQDGSAGKPSDSEKLSSSAPPRIRPSPEAIREGEIGDYFYPKGPQAGSAMHPEGVSFAFQELNIDDFFEDSVEEGESGISEGVSSNRDESLEGRDEVSPESAIFSKEEAPGREARAPEPSDKQHQPEAKSAEKMAEPIRRVPERIDVELFERFLKGTAIEMSSVQEAEIPELFEKLGAVFRELVNGLWTVLMARAELKAEIRAQMTMVRPASNNPLKFSPTLEEALKHLVRRTHLSFLEPVDAVREGFEDLINHQLAMHAGIQASLEEALDQFDPERFLENRNDSVLHGKGKMWMAYRQAYPAMKEKSLEGIFGKAFIRAYEEQLERLRVKRMKNQPQRGNGK
ncbi:MAG: type VI secretion system-associated FHA domain protein TagH [Syntrophobacteraceae bacterium]|nr:type VI secretion system-associated FHA domain protein TagH [Syntrophobacteraceae bacterium]